MQQPNRPVALLNLTINNDEAQIYLLYFINATKLHLYLQYEI